MTANPIDGQKFLSGVSYPTSKEDLVQHTQGSGATKEVVETLKHIPQKEYDSPAAISEAISGK